jgi:ACS family glucarate transporter-like MFS transporter
VQRNGSGFGTKFTVGVGIALWSLATIATGFARNFESLIATRVVMGIGESPTWPASIRVIREWTPATERGLLATVCYNGINAGVAFGAILISAVVSLLGWHAGFVVAGALGLVWLVAWQVWYGAPERVTWLSASERTKILTERDGDRVTSVAAPLSRDLPFSVLLQQPAVWGLVLNQGCIGYTTYLFLTWLPSYLQMAKHLSVLNAGLMTAVPYAISVVLGIALGVLSDRMLSTDAVRSGRRRIMVAVVTLSSAVILLAPAVSSTWVIVALVTICITANSTGSALNYALANDLLPDATNVGKVTSLIVVVGNAFGILAPIATGYLIAATGTFNAAFMIAGGLALLGAVVTLTLTRRPIDHSGLGQPGPYQRA